MKSIDLIKLLRGTQYSTKIEQFFEFDDAIKKLEEGFGKLKCSHPDCKLQAVMAFEDKEGRFTRQCCNNLFHYSNISKGSSKNIKDELNILKLLFYELEVQLVYIQDRIDYIKSDKTKEKMNLYAENEAKIQRNLNNISSILNTMSENFNQMSEANKIKAKKKAFIINFSDFSFVKLKLDE